MSREIPLYALRVVNELSSIWTGVGLITNTTHVIKHKAEAEGQAQYVGW